MNELNVRFPRQAARALAGRASSVWPSGIATTAELPASASQTIAPEAVIEALDALEAVIEAFTGWVHDVHRAWLARDEDEHGPVVADGAHRAVTAFDDSGWRQGCHRAILARTPTQAAMDRLLDDIQRLAARLDGRAPLQTSAGNSAENAPGAAGRPDAAHAFVATALEIVAGLHRASGEMWSLLVSIDPLTGLGNRPAMLQRLAIESERHARNHKPCCLAIIDIDRFKPVNDTHGHAAGDDVLRGVAGRLAASLRPYDAISRFGGEEFVVCLPNADPRTAWAIAERLRLKVSAEPLTTRSGVPVRVTISIGIAPLKPEEDVEVALHKADAALYIAKRDGRNAVVLSDDQGQT